MRPRSKTAAAVVAAVTMLLFASSTSWACYRMTMGPAQCCKSHCPHKRASSDSAERCCKKNLVTTPAAVSKVSPDAAFVGAFAASTLTTVALDAPSVVVFGPFPPDGRGPPTPSLFAQHTSLLR